MVGKVYIHGVIGDIGEVPFVTLSDVIAQTQSAIKNGATSLLIDINSPGGDCTTGHEMADYLESVRLPISTVASQKCCSMGSRLLMIGQTRTLIEPVDFLIHNPWTSGVQGDANYLEAAAGELRAEEDKLVSIYAKTTGISKEGIAALMREDKPMTAQKALDLGFATEIRQQLKAVAVLKQIHMEEKVKSKILKALDEAVVSVKNAFGLGKNLEAKALMATDDKGNSLEFWNADGTEATAIATGNVVMMAGQPAPDGVYNIPEQNLTIEILMGVVTTANPMQQNTEPTPEQKLQTALDEINSLKEELENEKKNSKEVEEKADKAITALKAIAAKHEPSTQVDFTSRNHQVIDIAKKAQERESTYKNKK